MKPFSSLQQIQNLISAGDLSCRDLVLHYLSNIQQHQDLNAFLEVYAEEAIAQAELIDAKFAQGTQGRLAGAVIGIKDVICYENHPLQCSSKILDGFQSQFSATVVERILAEDAIIIGRQNCDEFAMGSTNESSFFGPAHNAKDPSKVPGGSSGGSAVAVQADLCLLSIGSDTGGSVRQPASFCGVIGFKPTYSRISRFGLVAYASSFDTIGLIGKNPEDIALTLEIIAGPDAYDSTVSPQNVPAYSQLMEADFKKIKIAYFPEGLESDQVQEEVRSSLKQTLDELKAEGHEIKPLDFPLLEYILPVYYILTTAEASSNLARYDGIRYGFRSSSHQAGASKDLESLYKNTRSEGFGSEVKRRILLGTFVLSADYYDAYYTKAQKVRTLIKEATEKIFEEYDFVLLPVSPSTAFPIGHFEGDPLKMYLQDLFTVQANVSGIPAVSLPVAQDKEGMPIGLQVMAAPFAEAKLLSFSNYLLKSRQVPN